MSTPTGKNIRRSFGRAAPVYDDYAIVQQQIVEKLVHKVQHFALPFEPRILEIGAGTGTLTRKLNQLWPHADYIVTDVSIDMLKRARMNIGTRRGINYVAMDAGKLAVEGPFDLIVSSMILQWLPDPIQSIQDIGRLLVPGGVFAFAFLEKKSFSSWRQACDKVGVSCGLWDYVPLADVKTTPGVFAVQEKIQTFFDNAEGFLMNLKSIGSGTPRLGHQPLTPKQMKRALAEANRMKPFVVNYEVIFGAYQATSGIADLPNTVRASDTTS
ncbi:MAG: methyltransferase domain-containing protein [Alphaproteobacteria bacterium]|nr:MAG: methyltransferase domain-containing protein [Alphaproteobacteria bacterium]